MQANFVPFPVEFSIKFYVNKPLKAFRIIFKAIWVRFPIKKDLLNVLLRNLEPGDPFSVMCSHQLHCGLFDCNIYNSKTIYVYNFSVC